jgi:hypothetical protein
LFPVAETTDVHGMLQGEAQQMSSTLEDTFRYGKIRLREGFIQVDEQLDLREDNAK